MSKKSFIIVALFSLLIIGSLWLISDYESNPSPSVVIAQSEGENKSRLETPDTTQIDWPPSPLGTTITPHTQFHELIRYLYEWGIALGGIFVFVILVKGGIGYLTSFGDPSKMKESLGKIKSAIFGLILLLSSWLVLNTINPQLTVLEPLPNLWGGIGAPENIILHDPGQDVAPCHFILVYSKINFEGKPGLLSFDDDQQEVKQVSGEAVVRNINSEWASAKPFTRLTEEDKERKDKEELEFKTYNDMGEPDQAGNYKEGGHCLLDVFRRTGRWWWDNDCGRRIATASLPANDISRYFWHDDTITCVELIRTIPDLPAPTPEDHVTLHVNSSGLRPERVTLTGVTISSATGHGGLTNYTLTIDYDTVITLTAPNFAPGGWVFTSWDGCDSVSGAEDRSCNLTIREHIRTVTATYTFVPTGFR